MKNIVSLASVVLVASGLAMGCSRSERPANTSSDASQGNGAADEAAQRDAVNKAVEQNEGGGLNISEEIKQLCPGITSPKFGFDSSSLRGEWATALSRLADCMKNGKLAGRSVLLTGHTDPRGDDDYNMDLGGRRAEAVKSAITVHGVPGSRISVTSRGKVDARGTDEASWATDRRVDIDLMK